MNNQKLFLALLVLLVPACNFFKRKRIAQPLPKEEMQPDGQYYIPQDVTQFDYVTQDERQNYDENLDAFILNEEDNKFNQVTAADYAQNAGSEQELELAPIDQAGDTYRDSSIHGLKSIYYDFGKYRVKEDQQLALENNYAVIKDLTNKGYTVVCEGHACNSYGSSDSRNITISEERPQYVADYFIAKGANLENIKVVGRGAEMKIVPHGDRTQQSPNRRVEFYAYPPEAQVNA